MDGFDRLPDSLVLQIFDSVSDVKTLIRCRAVSKRFNSLVPQTDSLLLTVDRVISSDSDSDSANDDVSHLLVTFLKSILKSIHDLVSPRPDPTRARSQNSPAQILRSFHNVRNLSIELPSGDLRLEKGTVLKWRADFGKTLRSCVILGFRSVVAGGETPVAGDEADFAGGLKVRVVWTISALIAASARHYLLKEVVREQRGLETVRMRMRHVPRMELKGGVWVEGATLVVVRPSLSGDVEDGDLAMGAFGGDVLYGEVVEALLKAKSYLLEMNSF
ncbi:F-box protein [Prunus yedoensis var. nudiflora]|uniref:F-box protein n=1 Tax=Prunus yedoensis var. nudiflora TaxID=2094558 RepID=A0A314V4L0_PRUYE|nr:F-box protein [Prunus yedoensis var. nudiflora]